MKSKVDEWLTPDGLLLLKGWARNGLKDTLIAKNMGITAKTLYEWKNKYSDIREALKKGKEPADIEVEDALFKAAIGYYVTVKEPIKVKTKKQLKDKGTIEEEHVEFIEKETYIPPNPTAIIFWLKNRKPEAWRDRPMSAKDKKEMELMQARIDALTAGQGGAIDDKTRAEVDALIEDIEPEVDDVTDTADKG